MGEGGREGGRERERESERERERERERSPVPRPYPVFQTPIYTQRSIVYQYMSFPIHSGKEMVMPGDDAKLTLTLRSEIPLELNQRFTLREGHKTVGTGVVTEIIA